MRAARASQTLPTPRCSLLCARANRAAAPARLHQRRRHERHQRCRAVEEEAQQQQQHTGHSVRPPDVTEPDAREQPTYSRGLSLRYEVPFDIWLFIQVAAAVWVINQSIPFAVLSAAAHLKGLPSLAQLPLADKEVLGLLCQFAQLGSTYAIISTALRRYQPLPKPWFMLDGSFTPLVQGGATAIAAIGSGVLLSGITTGRVDGAEEWRHLAGLHAERSSVLALVLGAVVLAPLTEEYYFRGFVLPSLTKWVHPLAAVPLTGLLFASAHPTNAFVPEALLGSILSLALLAADGNLAVPLLAHSLYNTFVLGAEFVL